MDVNMNAPTAQFLLNLMVRSKRLVLIKFLQDVSNQVEAGAKHISFNDPDFL